MKFVKTNGSEYFYSVCGLMAPKYMVSEKFSSDVDFFVDWVTNFADDLETDLNNAMPTFVGIMEKLYIILCSINARWLEAEAARILMLTGTGYVRLLQKLIVPFISNLRTLAIDIEMAQSNGFENSYKRRNTIERYYDILINMEIITILMQNSDFDKALDITMIASELHESDYAAQLINFIKAKNAENAIKLAGEITSSYTEKIDSVIVAAIDSFFPKKILIVDDMPETLTALNLMIKDYYQVFAFSDSNLALSFIDKKHKPDAFLLDIDMPGMDGFILAGKIRAMPKYERTPILFLTSTPSREMIAKSAEYGAKAFIVKPANKNIIVSKLSSCVK